MVRERCWHGYSTYSWFLEKRCIIREEESLRDYEQYSSTSGTNRLHSSTMVQSYACLR
jgi:hypothetical protein